jgi:hypothetical protein
MTSPQTLNRIKKRKMLRESFDNILELMLYNDIQRDRVNMAQFKKLIRLVNEISYTANFGNRDSQNYTKDSEIKPAMLMARQDNIEENDLHDK